MQGEQLYAHSAHIADNDISTYFMYSRITYIRTFILHVSVT